MKPILDVKGLWKEYRRGVQKEKYLSLRDSLFKSIKPKSKKEKFWALQDINFDVYPGDSLAIIGKNGAGKSTLLKILSKITPPTRGEIIIRGRLASLLEVGTGFHAELTGRENIYLNGSILGLGRSEINRQFEAIVDFSGVEAFLDTPLKHYSTGMQLRLAFAVAAHLEPEILVIDEVLAVGDSVFQKKCIDKMTEVSQSGRTILFVSHNMQAIKNLCNKAILISNGTIETQGSIDEVVKRYIDTKGLLGKSINLSGVSQRKGKGCLIFDQISFVTFPVKPGIPFEFELRLKTLHQDSFRDLDFGIAIYDSLKNNIAHLSNRFINKMTDHKNDRSKYTFRCDNYLRPGTYSLVMFLRANEEIQDWISHEVQIDTDDENRYGFPNSEGIQGLTQPSFSFDTIES